MRFTYLRICPESEHKLLDNDEVKVTADWHQPRPGANLRQLQLKGIDFKQWEFNCQDCSKPMYNGYMVHNSLWFEAMGSGGGIMCMFCFENKLGRSLTLDDLTKAPINDPYRKGFEMAGGSL